MSRLPRLTTGHSPMHPVTSWPLAVALVFMLTAALFQWKTQCVPNRLTFLTLVAGLLACWLEEWDWFSTPGGMASSLLAGGMSFALLIPFYSRGLLGAGCVKAQAAFGVWVGCGADIPTALAIAFTAVVMATLLTGSLCYFALRLLKPEQRATYPFPAQITISLGSILAASWFSS